MKSVFEKDYKVLRIILILLLFFSAAYVVVYIYLGLNELRNVALGYFLSIVLILSIFRKKNYLTSLVIMVTATAVNSFIQTYYLGTQAALPTTFFAIIVAIFVFTPTSKKGLILLQSLIVLPLALLSLYLVFHHDPLVSIPELWAQTFATSTIFIVLLMIGGGVYLIKRSVEQSERELLYTRNNLQAIYNSTADVNILVDLEKKIINFNEPAARFVIKVYKKQLRHGMKMSEIISGKQLNQFNANFEQAKQGRDLEYNIEISVNGTNSWYETKYTQVFGEEDRLWGIGIIMNDITEKKRYQEEVRKLALVASEIESAVIITDSNEKIEWVNEGFTKITGYEANEVIGKKPSLLQGLKTSQKTKKEIRESLDAGEQVRVDILNYSKTGEEYWLDMTIQPLKDSQGNVERFIAVEVDITKNKEREEKLRRNEELLKEMGKIAQIGGWIYNVNTEGLSWTEETYNIFDIPRDAVLDFNSVINLLAPKPRETITNQIQRCIKEGTGFTDLAAITTESGEKKYIRYIGKAEMHDDKVIRLIGAVQDVTQQVEREHLALEKELQLESVNKNIQDGLYRSTPDNGMVYANEAFADIFGFDSVEEVIEVDIENLYLRANDRVKFLKKLLDKGTLRNYEIELKKKDGTPFWGLISGTLSKDDSGQKFIDGSVRDITKLKKTQEALVEAKDKAEKASMAKAEFLSTMSHEIRTPMNAVIGMTELLLMENPRDDQEENLETLKFSAENLLNLINDVLDYSKIEAGRIEFEEIEFNPKRLVRSLVKGFLPRAEDKGIYLQAEIDKEIPGIIIGDPTRLSQILSNLVSNAVKFTEKGGVQVKLNTREKKKDKIKIRFAVKDSGIGISRENQKHIFDSFQQADASITRKYGGTGLGLAIIKNLLSSWGTEIHVKSAAGKGSEFYFDLTFKYISRNEEESEEYQERRASDKPRNLEGLKVLIVEDNLINQKLTEKFLQKWNVDCDKANDGDIAVSMVKENKYDLVLMDLQMPKMDGYTATKEIRKFDKDTPIVAMSASAMLEIQDKVYTVGMNDFITKPVNPMDLNYKLSKYKK